MRRMPLRAKGYHRVAVPSFVSSTKLEDATRARESARRRTHTHTSIHIHTCPGASAQVASTSCRMTVALYAARVSSLTCGSTALMEDLMEALRRKTLPRQVALLPEQLPRCESR